jgi:hypothetical protein
MIMVGAAMAGAILVSAGVIPVRGYMAVFTGLGAGVAIIVLGAGVAITDMVMDTVGAAIITLGTTHIMAMDMAMVMAMVMAIPDMVMGLETMPI